MSQDDHPTAARQPAGTIASVEKFGKTWTSMSEEYLVGYVASFGGTDAGSQMPAVQEMQLRTLKATHELTTAVRASGDCTAEQNAQMVRLTESIRMLTMVVIMIGLVQVGLAIWGG